MPELVFKGKEYVYNHHLTVPYRPLIPHADKSIGPADLAGNLIIHGDNLHALKSLLPRYAGKVDLVFIDPPYNTGNENWSYNDNVNSPVMREWLKSNPVNSEDMLRHDKWLCMMWPRLTLLKDLLSERGSVWMTLDDNEIHRARTMLDDLFGEENFVAQFCWKSRASEDTRATTGVSTDHEYALCYSKDPEFRLLGVSIDESKFSNPDKDARGPWRSADMTGLATRERRPNLHYDLTNSETEVTYSCPNKGWRFEPSEMQRRIRGKRILWPESPLGRPRQKLFLAEIKRASKNVSTVLDFVHTGEGTREISAIFGENVFDFPKPTDLIAFFIEQATKSDSIVLDSFAGSGTTGHAVLKVNAKDEGSRRFILVECEDYADRITAERVRRVIKGYAWSGTQREELHREKLNWSKLQKAEVLLADVEKIKVREGFAETPDLAAKQPEERRFDRVTAKVEDGTLVVDGERRISERVEGLVGEFTFCTLGEPIDPEGILSGKTLPDYENLAAWLYYTATGGTLNKQKVKPKNWYLGEAQNRHLWLVYKPDLGFLKSTEAALTLSLAKKLREKYPNKGHLVFAPAKFLSNKQLLEHGVEYAPLPFALYRET